MKKGFQIAIDGPVAAGKSTVARELAEKLKLLYIDTGAMYRAVALEALKQKVDWSNESEVSEVARGAKIKLTRPVGRKKDGCKAMVYLDGEDVSWKIREAELGEGASVVSQYPQVRKVLVRKQQEMARGKGVVMEGRDIGTRVLPEADLKIYLDAEINQRVERKKGQLDNLGQKLSIRKVRKGIMTRDKREMTRKIDPLRPAEDAWVLDTTGLSIARVVDKIKNRIG